MSAARAGERIARRSRGYVCFDVAWAQGCVFLGMAFGVAGPPVVSPLLSCSGSWGPRGVWCGSRRRSRAPLDQKSAGLCATVRPTRLHVCGLTATPVALG